jgi:hypothetical protein
VILLAARQYVPWRSVTAGAKQRNPGVRRTGRREAGALLLRAGTECENDRDNRAVDGNRPASIILLRDGVTDGASVMRDTAFRANRFTQRVMRPST